MQTKNNLVRKIMSGVSGLALLVGLEGCCTTIPLIIIHQDSATKIWYDCKTDVDYPTGHPCYEVIAEYKAAHRSSSSSIEAHELSSDYKPGAKSRIRLDDGLPGGSGNH